MNKTTAITLRSIFGLLVMACAISTATAEEKAPSEKVMAKYDLDKDGKLNDEEKAKWAADKKLAAEKKKAEGGEKKKKSDEAK